MQKEEKVGSVTRRKERKEFIEKIEQWWDTPFVI
jgi:hypothetical protein